MHPLSTSFCPGTLLRLVIDPNSCFSLFSFFVWLLCEAPTPERSILLTLEAAAEPLAAVVQPLLDASEARQKNDFECMVRVLPATPNNKRLSAAPLSMMASSPCCPPLVSPCVPAYQQALMAHGLTASPGIGVDTPSLLALQQLLTGLPETLHGGARAKNWLTLATGTAVQRKAGP